MDLSKEEWIEKICNLIGKFQNPKTLWRIYNFIARLYGNERAAG